VSGFRAWATNHCKEAGNSVALELWRCLRSTL
jgi:hypothetical protein